MSCANMPCRRPSVFRRRPKRHAPPDGLECFQSDLPSATERRTLPASSGRTAGGENGEGRMTDGFGRRDFLKGAVAGVAATSPNIAQAQAQPAATPAAAAAPAPGTSGYAFLNI